MLELSASIDNCNRYIRNLEKELDYRSGNPANSISAECLSTTSLVSISEESLIEWVKEHLNKLGRRFVIIVNKIIAKFSKDKEQLEKNIELYKKDPKANVHLAVSPKTLKIIVATIVGITAAIGTIFMCVARKDGKRRIVEIYDKCKEQLDKVKASIRKDRKSGGADVKSSEAAEAATKTEESNEKTAGFFKSGMDKFKAAMKSANLTIREKLSNIGKAISKAFDLVKESSLLRRIFGKAEDDKGGDYVIAFFTRVSELKSHDVKNDFWDAFANCEAYRVIKANKWPTIMSACVNAKSVPVKAADVSGMDDLTPVLVVGNFYSEKVLPEDKWKLLNLSEEKVTSVKVYTKPHVRNIMDEPFNFKNE